MLIAVQDSALLIIDEQERLMPAIDNADRVLENTRILMTAAARLSVPILASEQYPKGLGPTVPAIATAPGFADPVAKTSFSCIGDSAYVRRVAELGRTQLLVTGVETHVCVLQTVFDLLRADAAVYVVADAVSSRRSGDRQYALERMRGAGAVLVTTEMVIFEWLRRAGTPAFKELSKLIK